MTSLLKSLWATESEKMDALRKENELLQKEHENVSTDNLFLKYEVDTLTDQVRGFDEERRCFLREQQRLCAQNEDKAKEIQELQSETLERQNTVAEMNAKDDKIRELQSEIAQYKRSISASTMKVGQVSDATIQGAMHGLFYAVQDWAIETVRQEKTILEVVARDKVEWLHNQVPGGKEGSSTRRVHALIALFSDAFCTSMQQGWIFGTSTQDGKCPLGAANFVYASLEKIPGLASEKKKQWVLLTNELLSKNEEVTKRSLTEYVDLIASHVRYCLGATEIASKAVARLTSAIRPHVHIVQALGRQEADYSLHLLPAAKGTMRYRMEPKYMEDFNGEDGGALEAVFFPVLVKKAIGEGNAKAVRAVISKSKVTVVI